MAAETSVSRMNARLAEAVDLFVMTKFEKCFEVCKSVIKCSKSEPEQERNFEVIEAATALGIQALAEIDLWHQAVAFVSNVYGTVDSWPPRIIQVCILLHAHVQEYLPCHKLVQSWLGNDSNLSHPQCAKVIRDYSQHILVPTGSYDILKEVIDSCASLTPEEKIVLLQPPQSGRYKDAKRFSIDGANEDLFTPRSKGTESCGEFTNSEQDQRRWSAPNRLQDFDNLKSHRSSRIMRSDDKELSESDEWRSKRSKYEMVAMCKSAVILAWNHIKSLWSRGFVVACMAVLAMWGLTQTQTGDHVSSLQRFLILWRAFLQRLGHFFKIRE